MSRTVDVRCPVCGMYRPMENISTRKYPRALDGVRECCCMRCSRDQRSYFGPAVRVALLEDRAWLANAYETRMLRELADIIGCDQTTVRLWLIRHEIPLRSQSESIRMRNARASQRRSWGRNRQMVTAGDHRKIAQSGELGDAVERVHSR